MGLETSQHNFNSQQSVIPQNTPPTDQSLMGDYNLSLIEELRSMLGAGEQQGTSYEQEQLIQKLKDADCKVESGENGSLKVTDSNNNTFEVDKDGQIVKYNDVEIPAEDRQVFSRETFKKLLNEDRPEPPVGSEMRAPANGIEHSEPK